MYLLQNFVIYIIELCNCNVHLIYNIIIFFYFFLKKKKEKKIILYYIIYFTLILSSSGRGERCRFTISLMV